MRGRVLGRQRQVRSPGSTLDSVKSPELPAKNGAGQDFLGGALKARPRRAGRGPSQAAKNAISGCERTAGDRRSGFVAPSTPRIAGGQRFVAAREGARRPAGDSLDIRQIIKMLGAVEQAEDVYTVDSAWI